ncbi:MAG: FMN-binding protein [Candidatus Omnitrophota bacterium]
MRNAVKMISVLTIVGLISGAALVLMYTYANPLIVKNQKDEMQKAIFKIFPDGKTYDKEVFEGAAVFKIKDKNGKLLGYAFLAEGNGYQGVIKIMAGIKTDLETLVGIEILESQETPGLGQEITTDKFTSQFKDLKVAPAITYLKNIKPTKPNEIQAITGATISSRAVVTILNEKIKVIKEHLGKLK